MEDCTSAVDGLSSSELDKLKQSGRKFIRLNVRKMAPATAMPGSAPQVIAEFHSNDVLLGRGAPIVNYTGNVAFREVVSSRKDEYVNTESHQVKDNIAREIVDEIGSRNGRFLRRVETPDEATRLGLPTGEKVWIVADDDVVIEKVKQALRDKIAAKSKASTSEAATSDGSPGGRKRRRLTPPSIIGNQESSARAASQTGVSTLADRSLTSLQEQFSSALRENPESQGSFSPSSNRLPHQAHTASHHHQGASQILSLLQQHQVQTERAQPSYLASFLTPDGHQPTQQNSMHGNAQTINLPLLVLQHLERTQIQEANQVAASLEALRRIEIAREEENYQNMALLPLVALQRLEVARAEEERQRIALHQLQLSRAEEESQRAAHSFAVALQRLEVARSREGNQLRGMSSLESLPVQHLGLSQLNERTRQQTSEILLERRREQETQQLQQLTSALSSVSSLPTASRSVLESFATLAEQHGASELSPYLGETTHPSSHAAVADSLSFVKTAPFAAKESLAGHVSDQSGNNESSTSSTSTNEQDRKPRARTNDDVDPRS